MRHIFLSLVIAFFVVGCATHRANSLALVSQEPQGKYEIQLAYVEWCAGGPCNFPQWPHRTFGTDIIRTDTTNGVVLAAELTLLHGNDPQYRWPQEDLLGSVTFTNGHMLVAFRVPTYADDDSIKNHVNYELNGNYKLQFR